MGNVPSGTARYLSVLVATMCWFILAAATAMILPWLRAQLGPAWNQPLAGSPVTAGLACYAGAALFLLYMGRQLTCVWMLWFAERVDRWDRDGPGHDRPAGG